MLATKIINSVAIIAAQFCKPVLALILTAIGVPGLAAPISEDANYIGHTLPQEKYQGYQPSMTVFVEQDANGQFHAINTEQARFNRVWMNQDSARTGNDAIKALFKMAVKHLYRSVYRQAGGSKYYVPDEEGRIHLSGRQKTELDYRLRMSSSNVEVSMKYSF
jgi:hypothetical protein